MSEIGTIGQIYEDRRTHKRGKLLERDEKYKTLLLEADDGKSFNITYGGFKSNWRKVDEPVQTIEEALEEVEVSAEIAEPVVEISVSDKHKSEKQKFAKKTTEAKSMSDFADIFNSFVASFNSEKVSTKIVTNRKGKSDYATVILGRNRLVELYLRSRGNFWIIMPEFVYTQKKTVELSNVTAKTKGKISCAIEWESLGQFLEDLRPLIVEILSSKVEEDK